MEILTLRLSLLSILAREGKPLKLTNIYKLVKNRKVSKPTVYRHLQNLVKEGILSQKDEEYVLVGGGEASIKATDFSSISELKLVLYEADRGFRLTFYCYDDALYDEEKLRQNLKDTVDSFLSSLDPDLRGILGDKPLSKNLLKKLIGSKFAFVLTFDGTAFSTLPSEEIAREKRKEILRLLAQTKGATINDLSRRLDLNVLQIRQVIDPILKSGFAEMDESGKIRLTLEVTASER